MKRFRAPLLAAVVVVVAAAVGYFAVLSLVGGSKGMDVPNTETKGAVEATGTVQATLPLETTPSAVTSLPAETTAATATPPTQTAATTSTAAVVTSTPSTPASKLGFWPAKVGTFAKNFKGPSWYPKYIPKGSKIDSLDVVELEPGAGLVCDMVFTDGTRSMGFMQGSPKTRAYAIVSAGKVAWGTEKADIVYEDPQDKTTPRMIVYSQGGTLAELSGDVSFADLKAVAASMVPVK